MQNWLRWMGGAALVLVACGDDAGTGASSEGGAGANGGGGMTGSAGSTSVGGMGGEGGGGGEVGTGGSAGAPSLSGLLAYEPFDYDGGISGKTGGVGFAEAWSGGGSVTLDGLLYAAAGATLDASGFALEVDGTSSSRRLDLVSVDAAFSDVPGKLGAAGASVWLSFIARSEIPIPPSGFGGIQLFDGQTEQRFVGAPFFTNDPARKQTWGLDRPGLEIPVYSEVPVTLSSLMLVRLDFGVDVGEPQLGSSVSLWVNPAVGTEENLGPANAVVLGPDFRFDTVRVNGHYSGFLVDELRVGTDFESVVPHALDLDAVFVEEGFDYGTEGPLFGTHEGSGFHAGWSSPNGASSKLEAVVEGLSYVDAAGAPLETSGGAVGFGSGPPGGRRIVSAGLPTSWSDTPASWGATGAVLWVSYLAKLAAPMTPDGRFGGLTLHENGFNDPSQKMFLGAPFYNDEPGRLPNWGFDRPGLAQPIYTDVPVGTEPTLLVAKLTFVDPGANVQLWVDPLLGDEATLPTPDVDVEHPAMRFNAIGLNSNLEGFLADEVRVGPTFASVTPSSN